MGWRPALDLRFAASLEAIALSVDEIGRAAQSLPVAFTHGSAGWRAIAVLSPGDGVNRFVDPAQGGWQGAYLPALLRAYPFRLADDGGSALRLWPGVKPEPLGEGVEPFTVDGQPSERVRQTAAFLLAVHEGILRVHEPLELLSAAGALVPWQLATDAPELQLAKLTMMRVDAERLKALPADTFLQLRDMDALVWIYAHMQSLHHGKALLQSPSLLGAHDLCVADHLTVHRMRGHPVEPYPLLGQWAGLFGNLDVEAP